MANIKGNNSNDNLTGTNNRDKIRGFGGDDFLDSLAGNDHIFGGRGNDSIFGGNGNDKLKGDDGNDTVFGGAGRDEIDGGKGDDTVDGGAGNDRIDGGKGTDTAVFHGDYDDFVVTSHHHHGHGHGHHNHHGHGHDHHDSKITVAGATAATLAANGIDTLEDVEFLKFDDATVNVSTGDVWTYAVNAEIDETAQKPATEDMIAGSGIPATNFGIARNQDAGIELGLKVHKRFDSPSTITTTDDYADGELHFQVDAGPGNPPTNNRAEWNFDFSVATGLNGATTDLSDFTFKLLYDVDKGAGTDYRVLTLEAESTPQAAGQSGFQWRDEGTGLVFISDDQGNANVTQNSENYGFGFIQPFIDNDAGTPGIQPYTFGPGEFDIVLQAFEGSQLVASNHMVVDVIV